MTREQEKQRDQNRKAERNAKYTDAYQFSHQQAQDAQNESNRTYGFKGVR